MLAKSLFTIHKNFAEGQYSVNSDFNVSSIKTAVRASQCVLGLGVYLVNCSTVLSSYVCLGV